LKTAFTTEYPYLTWLILSLVYSLTLYANAHLLDTTLFLYSKKIEYIQGHTLFRKSITALITNIQ